MLRKYFLFPSIVILLLLISSCQEPNNPVKPEFGNDAENSLQKSNMSNDIIPGQYIVVFKDEVTKISEVANKMANLHSAKVIHIFKNSIKGFTATMSENEALKLAKSPDVKLVEPDRVVSLAPPVKITVRPKPNPPSQSTPWGIIRVGGAGDGTGKTVWIIDTGVDLDHPDLNVDISRAATFVNSQSADDDNGHGTHVAGIIAALNNDIFVVGVAAGATVVPVKVLNKRGSGTISGVIAGIDYVAANAHNGDVANMSLGGSVSTALDEAVLSASNKGIRFSLAAGNESDNANNHSPARVNGPNIYTISAIDNNDVFAYFSNYGNPPVDYSSPGVSIYSLYKNGGSATMSGTSMASPHFAGILLLGNIGIDGYANSDPDGNPDPIAVHN